MTELGLNNNCMHICTWRQYHICTSCRLFAKGRKQYTTLRCCDILATHKLTESVGCSSNGTILPTPVSGWDGDGEGSAWVYITGVLSYSKHCTGTTTIDCDCHLLYTRCWGHIDIITINIKQCKVWWLYPASCDSNTSSTRDSFNLVDSNIQWSSWFICYGNVTWQQLTYCYHHTDFC